MIVTSKENKPVCVGLDVHKNNVWTCVCTRDRTSEKETLKFKTKKFNSNHTDLSRMCTWVIQTAAEELGLKGAESADDIGSVEVYMESTGKYSTPVYNVCEEMGLQPYIVNPKHVRMISGQKTDQKDCAWIAELGINNLLRCSYIPVRAIRDAKRLSRMRTKLVHGRADEIRRIQNILTEANIRVDLIFSGIDGESARNVIEYLMEAEDPTLEEVQSRIRRTCKIMRYRSNEERKRKEEELLKAFDGAKFSFSQKFELRAAYERLDDFSAQIRNYEDMMKQTLGSFKDKLVLLESVPGISVVSAMQILSEIGPDMSVFKNEKHFISWCGLCPQSNQSNNKHKSVKIGKGGYYLKPVLLQCALNAVKDEYYAPKYKSISARRGKKRALIAIARKMMVAVYHMFIKGELFNPNETEVQETVDRAEDSAEQLEESEEQAVQNEAIRRTACDLLQLTAGINPDITTKVYELFEQLGCVGLLFNQTMSERLI